MSASFLSLVFVILCNQVAAKTVKEANRCFDNVRVQCVKKSDLLIPKQYLDNVRKCQTTYMDFRRKMELQCLSKAGYATNSTCFQMAAPPMKYKDHPEALRESYKVFKKCALLNIADCYDDCKEPTGSLDSCIQGIEYKSYERCLAKAVSST